MTSHDLPTDPDRYTLHHRAIQVSTKRAASLTGARPASLTTRFMPAGWSTGVKSAGHHRVTTLTTRAQAKRTVDAEDLTQPDDVKKDVKGVYGGAAKLKEGLRRQTVLIYVADETGMINRVAVSLFLFSCVREIRLTMCFFIYRVSLPGAGTTSSHSPSD